MIDLDAIDKQIADLRRTHPLPNETVYASVPVDELDAMAQALREARDKARDRITDHMHRMIAERHINAFCTCEQCRDDRDWLARWFGK